MQARVKATGELIEVMQVYDKGKPSFERLDVLDTKVIRYSIDELNFAETIGLAEEEYWDKGEAEPICSDYWTRLEHQAAIAAMGGMCGNTKYNDYAWVDMAKFAIKAAHALVEKMKEEMK